MSINKVTIIGNLGQDPEVKTFNTANGQGSLTRISIATSEKDKNGNQITDWHNVTIFGKLGEIAAKYLHKGSKVYIEGKLKPTKYTDKEGTEKYTININVQGYSGVLQMLDPNPNGKSSSQVSDNVLNTSADNDDAVIDATDWAERIPF
jgi:single-strand DNA-binding protein